MEGFKHLVMVTSVNNNKYYDMIPNDDGITFTAKWGRNGSDSFRSKKYSMSHFWEIYKQKIDKGYTDRTDLVKETVIKAVVEDGVKYKPISDAAVAKIVEELRRMAEKTIETNYRIGVGEVTADMISEARRLIFLLGTQMNDLDLFNKTLLELFEVVPRKMNKVNNYLADKRSDCPKIISREHDLLDVMEGQVRTADVSANAADVSDKTILEAMGLEIRHVDEKEKKHIQKLLGGMSDKYEDAWRVKNLKTQERFDKERERLGKDKEVKELFHGSRNENWWSITTGGLKIRIPKGIITNGKMFGFGSYFALKAAKSAGYLSIRNSRWARGHDSFGYLGIFDVIYGDPLIIDRDYDSYRGLSEMTWQKLQRHKKGADCLHALKGKTGLREDEIVVYRDEQSTIKYLVKVSA